MIKRRFASNAAANVAAGASATLFQIGLTAIASRVLGSVEFGRWALALSLSALTPLFAVNLSSIVTRRLLEQGPENATTVMHAARQWAFALGSAALAGICLAGWGLQAVSTLLHNRPAWEFLAVVAVLTLGQLWQVLAQPRFGWHFAREHNWQVAITNSAARLMALLAVLAAALSGLRTPLGLALGLGLGAATGVLLATRWGSATPPVQTHRSDATAAAVRAERQAMTPLLRAFAVWALGSAAIQYVLPAFVSLIAPKTFTPFYLAYTLNLIVLGIVGAVASAMLAPLTRQRLAGEFNALERWLTLGPMATGGILLLMLSMVWYTLPLVLSVWSAGVAGVDDVRRPFFWLGLQTLVRSISLVYSVLLSSAGRPAQMAQPILMELALTVMIALPLGWAFGDVALLAALATAGLATAFLTMRVGLALVPYDSTQRAKLGLTFLAAQALACTAWTLLAR
jgi:hypothetical protein